MPESAAASTASGAWFRVRGGAARAGAYALAAGACVALATVSTGAAIALAVATIALAAAHVSSRGLARDALAQCRRDLVEAERRARAALLAASVAHDAGNLLCALRGEIEMLSVGAAARDDAGLRRARLCLDGLADLNQRLVDVASGAAPRAPRPVDLAGAVTECLALLRHHPRLRGCHVDRMGLDSLDAECDAAVLHPILANLVLNAAEATGGRGTVAVNVVREGPHAVVEVHDDGPGIEAQRGAASFAAFASTRGPGRGLGLFSVEACAREIGARVEVAGSPLGGALFRVRVPLPADRDERAR